MNIDLNQDKRKGSIGRLFLLGILLWGMLLWKEPPALAQKSVFHSFLTKDLTELIPSTTFSTGDRVYLYTVWTGLKGKHQLVVHWVRPDGKIQETTRFEFQIPPKTPTYRTWAWLAFKKGLLNISPKEGKFTGPWKAKLLLDGKLLAEYPFTLS